MRLHASFFNYPHEIGQSNAYQAVRLERFFRSAAESCS
jgi:hypothetical protein